MRPPPSERWILGGSVRDCVGGEGATGGGGGGGGAGGGGGIAQEPEKTFIYYIKDSETLALCIVLFALFDLVCTT